MNEFIIVSGVPRSGTSLQMQTLKHLGIELAGDEFPQKILIVKYARMNKDKGKIIEDDNLKEFENGPIIVDDKLLGFKLKNKFYENDGSKIFKRIEHAIEMNPQGFYEISGAVMKGVQDPEIIRNKAVKIIVSGFYERKTKRKDKKTGEIEEKIIGTKPEILEKAKIIFCLRDPRSIAISQNNLHGNIEIAGSKEFVDINKITPTDPTRYVLEMGKFYHYIKKENVEFEDRILKIDFDEMNNDPEKQIDRIINYLGIDVTDEQKQNAINNVNKKLRRSINFEKLEDKYKKAGQLAIRIYKYLKDGKEDENLLKDLNEFRIERMIEKVKWIESSEFGENGLYIPCNPVFYRQLKTIDELKSRFVSKYEYRINQTNCEFYDDSEEEYTIYRPKDIGNLTRKKVNCKNVEGGKNITIEQCFGCWRDKNKEFYSF